MSEYVGLSQLSWLMERSKVYAAFHPIIRPNNLNQSRIQQMINADLNDNVIILRRNYSYIGVSKYVYDGFNILKTPWDLQWHNNYWVRTV